MPSADSVGSEKQKVEQLADQLDDLENRIGELDEEYGAALDKKDELDQEIAVSQAKIAEQEARLGELAGARSATSPSTSTSAAAHSS